MFFFQGNERIEMATKTKSKNKAMLKVKQTHIWLVLDMRGSMQTNKQATIDAYNEYVSGLQSKKETNNWKFSSFVFNSGVGVKEFDDATITDAKKLTAANYQPDNITPLYDAIGKTVAKAEVASGKDAVLVVIQTDGEENA